MSFDHSMVKALLSSLQAGGLQSNDVGNALHWSVFQAAAVAVRKAAPEKMKYLCTPLRMKIEYEHLRRDYQIFQAYKSQKGFSVDQCGIVRGDAEEIDAYMEAHPEAVKFKDRPLAFEKELDDLFDAIDERGMSTSNPGRAQSEAFNSIETDSDVPPANKSIVTSNMRRRDALAKSERSKDAAPTYMDTESEADDSEDSESSTTESLANETLEAAVIAATRVAGDILARRTGHQGSSTARAIQMLFSGQIGLSEEDRHLAAVILTDVANAEIFLGVPPEHQQAMLQHFIAKEKAKRRALN
ncbi:hypothetical protein KC316_g4703 [Hortaea werneckii]|nr:hypothetical protein KC324_g2460 [Hortaea werneckii]KAI7588003.1 hypothetical protein KC316_g4703 [Hortaea werneckii]